MKTLFSLIVLLSYSTLAQADERPTWWSLPDRGENCIQKNSFMPKIDCGEPGWEVWQCVSPSDDDFDPARAIDYLIIGHFESDTGEEDCSPTFLVDKVVEERSTK